MNDKKTPQSKTGSKTLAEPQEKPAVLTVRIIFNGPVNDGGLDHFTQLLDTELGHIRDKENQRVIAKSGKLGGGWGYGRSMVLDVERVQ